jgi:multiple sugar transport system permease protein
MSRTTVAGDRYAAATWRRRARYREILSGAVAYLLLSLGTVAMIVPFIWMISTSLKRPGSEFIFPPQWIPSPVYWYNYVQIFTVMPLGRYMLNSLYYAGLATIGRVLSCSMAGFAFARLRFPGKRPVFVLLLMTIMIPYQVTMIPVYIIVNRLRWLDTYWPLVLPAFMGGAFGTFLLRQYFMSIPEELMDAAKIDGASLLGIYWQIFLPLATPALATLAVFTFLGAWNDLLGPLIFLSTILKYTVSMGLTFWQSQHRAMWAQLMASTIVSLIPVLILFVLGAQRYFVQGIATAGLKR